MPGTGTPSAKTAVPTCRAPSSKTLAGPPDSTTAIWLEWVRRCGEADRWGFVNRMLHWVTVAGYAIKGDRLFLTVSDPDDGKTGHVTWELDRNGNSIKPKGKMLWAVPESYIDPTPTTPAPPNTGGLGDGPTP